MRKEIVVKAKKKNLVSFIPFFLLISFPLLFPYFERENAQPRCRAASHPISTGYGKLILSNAILRRGYLPIPMDTAQVSPLPFPCLTFESSPTGNPISYWLYPSTDHLHLFRVFGIQLTFADRLDELSDTGSACPLPLWFPMTWRNNAQLKLHWLFRLRLVCLCCACDSSAITSFDVYLYCISRWQTRPRRSRRTRKLWQTSAPSARRTAKNPSHWRATTIQSFYFNPWLFPVFFLPLFLVFFPYSIRYPFPQRRHNRRPQPRSNRISNGTST